MKSLLFSLLLVMSLNSYGANSATSYMPRCMVEAQIEDFVNIKLDTFGWDTIVGTRLYVGISYISLSSDGQFYQRILMLKGYEPIIYKGAESKDVIENPQSQAELIQLFKLKLDELDKREICKKVNEVQTESIRLDSLNSI